MPSTRVGSLPTAISDDCLRMPKDKIGRELQIEDILIDPLAFPQRKDYTSVPSVPVLVNLISKREKQLIAGEKPLVMPESSEEDKVDTALREVAEGKLISEIDFDAIARAEDAKTRHSKHPALKSIFAD